MGEEFAGLDLSSKIDISAFVRLYEPEEGGIMRIACRFWMPADTIEERADRDRRPYRRWVEEGWIEATPGNVIDHAEIKAAIIADAKRCEIESMAYDPWNATQLAVELNEAGVEAVEFVQGMRSYTAPTKELQALIADRKLDHGDNPVLTVMASNLKVQRDKNLNEMPNKAHSTGRIDGITALIMALGRRMTVTQRGEPDVFFV
jgi:phage terminase large subunit-like protein